MIKNFNNTNLIYSTFKKLNKKKNQFFFFSNLLDTKITNLNKKNLLFMQNFILLFNFLISDITKTTNIKLFFFYKLLLNNKLV